MHTFHDPYLEELKHAQLIAAKVVAIFGDAYLPIFERVLRELHEHQKALSIKSLAISIYQNEFQLPSPSPQLSHKLSHILTHS
ncbi:hypothetical protein SAMN04488109_2810 [Chryseolinea serpens]|uniref:Uncharacterized protein n=1 Tax=Chryseolinea serpens TaxID=947013 RepID=A0A1M5PCT4_9BACT|nr:hypothetical protein SAMN04488109_2810 [Chryseolinea serpens]